MTSDQVSFREDGMLRAHRCCGQSLGEGRRQTHRPIVGEVEHWCPQP